MDGEDILQRLSRIRFGPESWTLAADLVCELEALPVGSGGIRWRERAAEALGCTVHKIQFMVRAKSLLEDLSGSLPEVVLRKVRRWPLSHVELLTRIDQMDRGKVLEICKWDEDKAPTFRAIQAEYDLLRADPEAKLSRHATAQMTSRNANKAFEQAVKVAFTDEPNEARFVGWPGGFPYASPNGLITRADGKIEAVCWLRSLTDKDKLRGFVQTTLAEHSFFDRYWWVIAQEALPFFEGERSRLALSDVGIISLDLTGGAASIRTRPTRAPVPDRTALTRHFLNQRSVRMRWAEGDAAHCSSEEDEIASPSGP